MFVEVLSIIFPLLLFTFKYILPNVAKSIYKKDTYSWEKLKIELMHFPVDLIFVAIGYKVPKTIEYINSLQEINSDNIANYQDIASNIWSYCAEILIFFIIIPFAVFLTEAIEENYHAGKKRWIVYIVFIYIISMLIICFSLFR